MTATYRLCSVVWQVVLSTSNLLGPMSLASSLAWPDPTRKEGSGPMPNMDLCRAVST